MDKKRRIGLSISLIFLFIFVAAPLSADAQDREGPSAVALEPRFEFEPVVEGAEVVHEFLVENKGVEVLKILKAETGCGCATADFSRVIQPGATGRVLVKADTEGYGGKTFHQVVEVITSDPLNEKLVLELVGPVKKFAEITPRRLMLKGSVNDDLRARVTIKPDPAFDFRIETAETIDLNDSVEVTVDKDGDGFLVNVRNRGKTPGIYVGKIVLKTDSKEKPEIEIPLLMGLKP